MHKDFSISKDKDKENQNETTFMLEKQTQVKRQTLFTKHSTGAKVD